MEIEKAVDELRDDVREFNEESLKPIKERLLSLEERDSSPSDNAVADLEKRLIEGEQKLEEMNEKIRLAQVNNGLIPATEKSSDPFKGFLFKDIDAVRHELLYGDTRAVNLAAIASAGKLTDETASAFLDFVVGDQPTLGVIERRTMNSPTARLDRIGVGARKMVAGVENTAVSDTDAITFGARTLTVTEAVWAEDLSLSFLEDNIAGNNAEAQIANVVAKAIGEELNDLAWNGDGSTGTFLSINTGFEALFAADSDVLDTASQTGVTDPTTVLNALYQIVPSQYRMLSDQTIFVSPAFATGYMNNQSSRATALGDSILVGGGSNLRYFGVPLVIDRHQPEAQAYMSPTSNLVFGVHRDVTQELEWRPRSRQIELTVSLRFDYEYKFGGVVGRAIVIDGAGLVS